MVEVSIITATGDRPTALRLSCEWMKHQTILSEIDFQWIIVDDSQYPELIDPVFLKNFPAAEVVHLPYDKRLIGPKSLARNLRKGLELAKSKNIIFWEDDDIYLPHHLYTLLTYLKAGNVLVGSDKQAYYHWPSKSFKIFKNRGSALCSTGISLSNSEIIKCLNSALKIGEAGNKGIDAILWTKAVENKLPVYIYHEPYSVIGFKGLPGRHGIGVGHHPKNFLSDDNLEVLKQWASEEYIQIIKQVLNRKG